MSEDNTAREYKYQWDWTIPGGGMAHVRCDDFEEFKEAKKNIETLIPATPTTKLIGHAMPDMSVPPFPSYPPRTLKPNPVNEDGEMVCTTCGMILNPEKRIVSKKDGRAWWVRDCPSGDRTHKGMIRPAS